MMRGLVIAGVVLAVLQFAFALMWVVYAAFLPALAAQVGIAKSVVPWILLADQAIFMVCDWLAGVFADRAGDAVVRLGRQIALVTVVSCAAFLALPLVAPGGSAPLLIALIAIWSVTSSMLRAPPLVMAGRYAARPQRAWLAGLYAFGLGAAGAVSPYLAPRLAAIDPRIPFVATSLVVAVVVIALAAVPRQASAVEARVERAEPIPLAAFVVAIAALAIGFQVHGSITSTALYLRHATRDELASLLPVFWIGFAVAALVVAPVIRRAGGLVVMTGAGIVGVAALVIAALAGLAGGGDRGAGGRWDGVGSHRDRGVRGGELARRQSGRDDRAGVLHAGGGDGGADRVRGERVGGGAGRGGRGTVDPTDRMGARDADRRGARAPAQELRDVEHAAQVLGARQLAGTRAGAALGLRRGDAELVVHAVRHRSAVGDHRSAFQSCLSWRCRLNLRLAAKRGAQSGPFADSSKFQIIA
jgi:MFS family permease